MILLHDSHNRQKGTKSLHADKQTRKAIWRTLSSNVQIQHLR